MTVWLEQISLDGDAIAARRTDPRFRRPQARGVTATDCNPRIFRGELPSNLRADTAGSARDEHNLSAQTQIHRALPVILAFSPCFPWFFTASLSRSEAELFCPFIRGDRYGFVNQHTLGRAQAFGATRMSLLSWLPWHIRVYGRRGSL